MTTARRRLLLGGFFGLLASLASIGLLLVSAWLISRAAQHPPVLYLMVAIVAVRAFGIARAALRYVERLYTHDGALRIGTEIRLAVYERLERLSPSTLAAGRRGERIARIVSDVDALQDRIVRVVIPRVVTALSAAVVVGLVLAVFPLGDSGRARLIGTVRDERAEHAETLRFEDVSSRAIEHMKVKIEQLNWFSTYRVHHRVADHFRNGRLLRSRHRLLSRRAGALHRYIQRPRSHLQLGFWRRLSRIHRCRS
jgi:ABC-type multidrug transport system fused ATPase/permease subunit